MTQAFTATFVALSILGAASSARAESAEARAACTPSVFQLCPGAALSGNREMAKACLLRNLAHASARCQAAVRAEPPADPVRERTDRARKPDLLRQADASRPA